MNIKCKEVEIEITTECNAYCFDCNHLCSDYQAPDNQEMSPSQLEKFFNQSIELKNKGITDWNKIGIIGGEPTLHSKFYEIVEITKYFSKILNFDWAIASNMKTNKTREIVSDIIKNHGGSFSSDTNTTSRYQPSFRAINLAPIDLDNYNGEFDCNWSCGFGLNRYGFYNCGPGAAIDRAIGIDVGIKNLEDLNKQNLELQMRNFCRYCGFKCVDAGIRIKKQWAENNKFEPIVSTSWYEIFEEYKKSKPELTPF